MTAFQGVFLFTAAFTLLAAIMVVTRRNLVHAALYLVVSLFGVAVTFVLLEAGFLAVVQVLVYIGAIAILFIFAIMLTRRNLGDEAYGEATNQNWPTAAAAAFLLFTGLVVIVSVWPRFNATAPRNIGIDPIVALGQRLVDAEGFLIPFEVASVLLLAALIGAIYVAYQRERS